MSVCDSGVDRCIVRFARGFLLFWVLFVSSQVLAKDDHGLTSLFEMSLEELMNVQVTSVSKTCQNMKDVDASVYVITEDDIRRSGSTHLLDVLNMVPGVWLQEISRNVVAFGVRSKIDEYPSSVRVLLDGVPIWSPVTGGPMFQYLNIPVEQIERIEVIKGPGGTIYGANANTGIISIYTKSPEHSPGTTVKLSTGTQDYVSPFLRFGGKPSENSYLSGFVSYLKTSGYDQTDAFKDDLLNVTAPDGTPTTVQNRFPRHDVDGQEAFSVGGQLQVNISDVVRSTSRFFLSSTLRDAYTKAKISDTVWVQEDDALDYFISERLDFEFSASHSAFVHAYYRQQDVDVANDGGWNPKTSIAEIEFQDNLSLGINSLSFGLNYSLVCFDHENGIGSDMMYFDLNGREQLYGAFVQDTMALSDMVDLTLGVKAETWTLADNEPELSPSIRLAVKPDDELILWSAVSRSVTTPGYFHLNMEHRVADVSGDGSAYVAILPADSIKPSEYITYELGLRTTLIPKTYTDISLFYSEITDFIGLDSDFASKDMVASKVGDYMVLPMYFTNTEKGFSCGGEALVRVKPTSNISLEMSYSVFYMEGEGQAIPGQPGSIFTARDAEQPFTPEHIVRLRQYIDMPSLDVSLMLGLMWASESWRGDGYDYVLQAADAENGVHADEPDDLIKVDFNIEKRWNNSISFNIWGRNIFADDYVEFYSQYVASGYPHTVHRTFGCSVGYQF